MKMIQIHHGSDAPNPASSGKRRVVFLILPNVHLLDLGGPAQVFHSASLKGAAYQLEFQAAQPEILSAQGLQLAQLGPLAPVSANDFVIVPGTNSIGSEGGAGEFGEEISTWLRNAYQSGAHIASVCTGAFALGEAGLLDGRRCTTHWESVSDLQNRYPKAQVMDAALYIHDQHITTSAGIASGIDMALSFVERDYGPIFAAQIARYLVVYMRRSGSQPQISIYLEYRTHLYPGVHRVQDYLIAHAAEYVSLNQLAAIANMSVRHLTRLFKEATSLTPTQYQQRLRLELARNLLNNPQLTIDQVAAKCGFEDARHFRRLWRREFGSPPSIARALATSSRIKTLPKGLES